MRSINHPTEERQVATKLLIVDKYTDSLNRATPHDSKLKPASKHRV